MPYTTDWKPTAATNPKFKCPKCGSQDVFFRDWESSDGAHDDTHYECRGCNHTWWIEDSDY